MGINSAKYNAVSNGIDSVLTALNSTFVSDPQAAEKGAEKVHKGYGSLLHACKVYNSKSLDADGNGKARTAHFAKGRARQSIVRNIEQMAQSDYANLNIYLDKMSALPPEERAKNAQEALQMARTRQLSLKGTWAGQKHLGGAVSDLAVVNEGEFTNTGSSGLFKAAEVIKKQAPAKTVMDHVARMQKKMTIDDATYKLIAEIVDQNAEKAKALDIANQLKAHPMYFKNIQYHEFADLVVKSVDGEDTAQGILSGTQNIKLQDGDEVNFAKLNVASARFAKLLGVGNLITQSEMAQLNDSQGNTIDGFLMQKAEGTDADDYFLNVAKKDVDNALKKGLKISTNSNDLIPSIKSMITPAMQKSLSDLQVLDNLLGQVDRHSKNYMVQSDGDGRAIGVTGIDNDFSFGQNKIGSLNDQGREERGLKAMKYAIDSKGRFMIPHMSASLANHIMAIKKPQLVYALGDVLSSSQLNALWGRTLQMQQAIAAEKKKNPKSRRFLEDDEWNDETLDEFDKTFHNTYLGSFMHLNDLECARNVLSYNESYQVADKVWEDLRKEGKMNTPEKTIEFLQGIKFKKENLQYLIESGMLEQLCAGSKGFPFKALVKFFPSQTSISNFRSAYKSHFNKYMTYTL